MAKNEDTLEELEPGDLIGYKEKQFLFRGINLEGGPRMNGKPDPVFGMPKPSVTFEFYIDYYLRNQQNQPEGIPTEMLESSPPIRLGHLNYVAFLNAERKDLNKIRHIPKGEWIGMIKELQTKLEGYSKQASKVIAKALDSRDYNLGMTDIEDPHLVSNSPIFGVGGCGCGCAHAFQFYLDEHKRIGITLPNIYESNFWHDDEKRTKQRSLEEEVKREMQFSEVLFIVGDDPKPSFLEPFLKY